MQVKQSKFIPKENVEKLLFKNNLVLDFIVKSSFSSLEKMEKIVGPGLNTYPSTNI